jgi:hypothetical protein
MFLLLFNFVFGGAIGQTLPPGVDSYISVSGGAAASPLDAEGNGASETLEIDGAGRVDLDVYAGGGFPGGATALDVRLQIWDEELRRSWSATVRLPDTEEGRRTADIFLGSLRVVS